MKIQGPAVALLELESIARGMVVADAVLKRAHVKIHLAEAVTPGKYLLLFSGGVGEVEESLVAGVECAGALLLDRVFLPRVAEALVDGLDGRFATSDGAVAIIETQTVASAIVSADSALKRADVVLSQLSLAKGIAGKGVYVLEGELHMVEAALSAVSASVEPSLLIATELIHRPHLELRGPVLPDFKSKIQGPSR
jgi:microcompartment protein CcmL/EutN